MKKSVSVLVLSFVFLLSACGGGSSTGAGSATIFAGTYNGIETLTITFLGQTESGSGPVTITIASNGAVTVTDENGTTYHGNLSGDSFSATGGAENVTDPSLPGATCDTNQTYNGTVSGDTITGTTSGSLSCEQGGSTFNATFSGNFNATRNS